MAGCVNKVMLIGHLGRDPETRQTRAGGSVVLFSLATSEHWRDKASGERKERTEWHNVVIYNEQLGKIAAEYLRKGSLAYVVGKLATRSYTDKDGVERKVSEIVLEAYRGELAFLDRAERPAPDASDYGREQTRLAADDPRMAMGAASSNLAAEIGDDIPF